MLIEMKQYQQQTIKMNFERQSIDGVDFDKQMRRMINYKIYYIQMQQVSSRVGLNYEIIKKIDEGSFGKIYQAINTKTKMDVAIKFQSIDHPSQQLLYEFKLYKYLHNDPSVIDKGIPHVYYCSTQGKYNVLVMDLMGPSLESLFSQASRKFSLKTVLMLIDQMIKRVQYLHTRNFLHRDIKPDNFCMGANRTANRLFMLDFGLAKRYIRSDGRHIEYKQGKSLTGTARYASINTHLGIQQARRDDMEGIGYVMMYFLRGSLPWQGLQAKTKKQKYERIKDKKIKTSAQSLCKGFPEEFAKYLMHAKNLRFDERPDYQSLRKMFKELFEKQGYKLDYEYDWVSQKA